MPDMAFFEWKDEYSTGLGAIDDQHKVIVRLMNALFIARIEDFIVARS
jgi:hemerythrin